MPQVTPSLAINIWHKQYQNNHNLINNKYNIIGHNHTQNEKGIVMNT